MPVSTCKSCNVYVDTVRHVRCLKCGERFDSTPPVTTSPATESCPRCGSETPGKCARMYWAADGTRLCKLPGTGRMYMGSVWNGSVHEVEPTTGIGVGKTLKPRDPGYPTAVGLAMAAQRTG